MNVNLAKSNELTRRASTPHAFTLVELLVVIAIIAIVAGLVVGVAGGTSQKKARLQTQAEMKGIQASLELYKSKLGMYPQNPKKDPLVNPLFYELTGLKYTNSAPGVHVFTSVQDPGHMLTSAQANSYFGLQGFVNFTTDASANMEILLPLTPARYGKLLGTGPYLLKVPAKVPQVNAANTGSSNNVWNTSVSGNQNYWLYRVGDKKGFNPNGYDLWAELPGKDAKSVEVVSSWGQ